MEYPSDAHYTNIALSPSYHEKEAVFIGTLDNPLLLKDNIGWYINNSFLRSIDPPEPSATPTLSVSATPSSFVTPSVSSTPSVSTTPTTTAVPTPSVSATQTIVPTPEFYMAENYDEFMTNGVVFGVTDTTFGIYHLAEDPNNAFNTIPTLLYEIIYDGTNFTSANLIAQNFTFADDLSADSSSFDSNIRSLADFQKSPGEDADIRLRTPTPIPLVNVENTEYSGNWKLINPWIEGNFGNNDWRILGGYTTLLYKIAPNTWVPLRFASSLSDFSLAEPLPDNTYPNTGDYLDIRTNDAQDNFESSFFIFTNANNNIQNYDSTISTSQTIPIKSLSSVYGSEISAGAGGPSVPDLTFNIDANEMFVTHGSDSTVFQLTVVDTDNIPIASDQDILYIAYKKYPVSNIAAETLPKAIDAYNGYDYTQVGQEIASLTPGSTIHAWTTTIFTYENLNNGARPQFSEMIFIWQKFGEPFGKVIVPKLGLNLYTDNLTSNGLAKDLNFNPVGDNTSLDYYFVFEDTEIYAFISDSTNLNVQATRMKFNNNTRSALNDPVSLNILGDNYTTSTYLIDTWIAFNENKFANPVTFYSRIFIGNENIISQGDLIAAFVTDSDGNQEIRGVTRTIVNYENIYNILETTIFTDAIESTELIQFKLYKATDYIKDNVVILPGNSIYQLNETLAVGGLVEGGMYSTGIEDSFIFNIGELNITLKARYDDFSYNLIVDSPSKEIIFGSKLQYIQSYRSQRYVAIKDANNNWISSVVRRTDTDYPQYSGTSINFHNVELLTTTFYNVRLTSEIDLGNSINFDIKGIPIPSSTTISLKAGFNWLGYPLGIAKPIDDVFGGTNITDADGNNTLLAITTRKQGAALYSSFNGTFVGSLKHATPGGSYVVYVKTPSTITYTPVSNTESVASPAGFYRITNFNNPLPIDILSSFIYIENGILGFVIKTNNGLYGFLDNKNYQGFGVHDTGLRVLNHSYEDITFPNLLTADLNKIQLEIGFTMSDSTINALDRANGQLNFGLFKEIDPLSYTGESDKEYLLSEFAQFLSDKPPFTFEAEFDPEGNVESSIVEFMTGNYKIDFTSVIEGNLETFDQALYIDSVKNILNAQNVEILSITEGSVIVETRVSFDISQDAYFLLENINDESFSESLQEKLNTDIKIQDTNVTIIAKEPITPAATPTSTTTSTGTTAPTPTSTSTTTSTGTTSPTPTSTTTSTGTTAPTPTTTSMLSPAPTPTTTSTVTSTGTIAPTPTTTSMLSPAPTPTTTSTVTSTGTIAPTPTTTSTVTSTGTIAPTPTTTSTGTTAPTPTATSTTTETQGTNLNWIDSIQTYYSPEYSTFSYGYVYFGFYENNLGIFAQNGDQFVLESLTYSLISDVQPEGTIMNSSTETTPEIFVPGFAFDDNLDYSSETLDLFEEYVKKNPAFTLSDGSLASISFNKPSEIPLVDHNGDQYTGKWKMVTPWIKGEFGENDTRILGGYTTLLYKIAENEWVPIKITVPNNNRQLIDYETGTEYPPANVGDYMFLDKVETQGAFVAFYPFANGNILRTLTIPIDNFTNVYGSDITAGAGGPETPTFFLDKSTYNPATNTIQILFNASTLSGGNGNISAFEIRFNNAITLVNLQVGTSFLLYQFLAAVGPQALGCISVAGVNAAQFTENYIITLEVSLIDIDNVEIISASVTDSELNAYTVVI
jgi:hypothetical protein